MSFRAFTLIILLISAMLVGAMLNQKLNSLSKQSKLLSTARERFQLFKDNFNNNKKSILIIGTSTSQYSFANNLPVLQKESYASLVSKKANVLNLAMDNLEHHSEAKFLQELAINEFKKFDYIIIENLHFLKPEPFVAEKFDTFLAVVKSCVFNNFPECHSVFSSLFAVNKADFLFEPPCIKKYEEDLQRSFYQNSESRIRIIKNVLSCSIDSPFRIKTIESLGKIFRSTHLNDLLNAVSTSGLQITTYDDDFNQRKFGPIDMLFARIYLPNLTEKSNYNYVIIPNPAKNTSTFKNYSAVRQSNVVYIDITDKIRKQMDHAKLRFSDVFIDGAHSTIFVHELISEEILNLLESN